MSLIDWYVVGRVVDYIRLGDAKKIVLDESDTQGATVTVYKTESCIRIDVKHKEPTHG